MILSPYGLGRPGIDLMTKTYIDTLVEGGVNAEHICVEFLNVNQEAAPELRRTRRDFLNKRYKGQHVDLIVTLHPPALRFLLEELPDLSVPAPVLAMTAPRPASTQGRRIFLQTSSPDYAGTISQALQLFPKTQRVVVLLGVGDADQVARRNVERAAAQWKGRLVFEYTDDLTLAQMRHRVANLPPDTILLCSSVNRDRTGDTSQQYDMARQAIRLANAPPFVLFSVTLGMGSVGGSVQHIEQDAARMGHRSLAILAGELRHSDAEDVMTLPSEPTPMYDWQALERWGADPDRLPPDTIFMNRPLSLWQQHRVTVQTTLAAFFILVLLLTALLVQAAAWYGPKRASAKAKRATGCWSSMRRKRSWSTTRTWAGLSISMARPKRCSAVPGFCCCKWRRKRCMPRTSPTACRRRYRSGTMPRAAWPAPSCCSNDLCCAPTGTVSRVKCGSSHCRQPAGA